MYIVATQNNISKPKQKELAEKIGVSASQLSRIVSGETRTVSSDILIGVAKEFKVSTDYIPVSYTHLDVYKRQLGRVRIPAMDILWRYHRAPSYGGISDE